MYPNAIDDCINCVCMLMIHSAKPLSDWYAQMLGKLVEFIEIDKDEDMCIVSIRQVVKFI